MREFAFRSWMSCTVLATLVCTSVAIAEAAKPSAQTHQGGLKALADDAWDYASARHLLVRAGFGGTPAEVEDLHAMGLKKAVDFIVDYQNQPEAEISFEAKTPQELEAQALETLVKKDEVYRKAQKDPTVVRKFSREQRQAFSRQRRREDQTQMGKVRDWWMKRLVESPRPLQEKLVVFWHGHFANEYRTVRDSYAMYAQNELFRKHAAGNFGQLLHEIVHDAAMLRYLDNNRNVKGRPNENLAREIMELFSMGEGKYTEEDIKEAARALTGYTYNQRTCEFTFRERSHDTEEKTVFGKKGNWDGDQLVDLILEEPITAEFIAGKLFAFFVHENPDDKIVKQLAHLLRDNDYELAPTLKVLFRSQEFHSPKAMATQIKSPVQLAVGSLRDLGVRADNYAPLVRAVREMGQNLFDPPNVKGWEGGRTWVNSNRIFVRYNFVADVLERMPGPGGQRGIDVVAALESKDFTSSAEVVDYLAKSCFVVSLDEQRRSELIEFLGTLPPSSKWEEQKRKVNAKLLGLLVLIISTPEYQVT
ncbi:MAG: hypothetical protein CMJ50_06835 [Planctomycetaceae bacterium]|nr:hypothetical protein [Planctomycetaceae bacterium]